MCALETVDNVCMINELLYGVCTIESDIRRAESFREIPLFPIKPHPFVPDAVTVLVAQW